MVGRVVLVAGSPCVGKSSVAAALGTALSAVVVNLTDFARAGGFVVERDATRGSDIVAEEALRSGLGKFIRKAERDVVIDGHFAAAVVPKALVSWVFVLRRNPLELREFMGRCGFSAAKMEENLQAEILDVCLVEALRFQGKSKVCELDVTGKTVEEVVAEILDVLNGKKPCCVGVVDWLGFLEREGKLSEFMKP